MQLTSRGEERVARYWHFPRRDTVLGADHDYEDRFRELFFDAVESRIPTGVAAAYAFSGGIDSSSLIAAASRLGGAEAKAIALSVSFADPAWHGGRYDEGRYRQWVPGLGIDLIEVPAREALTMESIDHSLRSHEGPTGGIGVLMRQLLYREAANRGASVLVDGVDGDATVAYGHERLFALLVHAELKSWANEVRAIKQRLGPRRAIRAAVMNGIVSPMFWLRSRAGLRPRSYARSLVSRSLIGESETWDRLSRSPLPSPGDTRGAHIYDLTSGSLAFTIESCGMLAASFELDASHPFCDRRLVEFCVSLPQDQFFRDGISRSIQRRALADLLPREVVSRTDKGGLPPGFVAEGLRLFPLEDLASSGGGRAAEYVDAGRLRRAYAKWRRRPTVDLSYALYPVALLDRWLELQK
jgi:asparagine synthase (glutamine-hydrolysing)